MARSIPRFIANPGGANTRLPVHYLLKLYLDKLAEKGVKDAPDFEAAFLLYRQQLFHALIYWTFTIGSNAKALRPAEVQPHKFCLMNIERFSNAIVDLESLDSLK